MQKLIPAPRLLTALLIAMAGMTTAAAQSEPSASYIVQGATLDSARTHVSRVGAESSVAP